MTKYITVESSLSRPPNLYINLCNWYDVPVACSRHGQPVGSANGFSSKTLVTHGQCYFVIATESSGVVENNTVVRTTNVSWEHVTTLRKTLFCLYNTSGKRLLDPVYWHILLCILECVCFYLDLMVRVLLLGASCVRLARFIPEELGNLPRLELLRLRNNQLGGKKKW